MTSSSCFQVETSIERLGSTMIASSYFYVWNDIEHRSLVASGLRFADFLPLLQGRGVLLLRHHFECAQRDPASELEYVDAKDIQSLAIAAIYSWGDFYWADWIPTNSLRPTADEISDLQHFTSEALPRNSSHIVSLDNELLVAAHDDGWYVRAFYSRWDVMSQLVKMKAPQLTTSNLDSLERGVCGFWVQDGEVRVEEKTFDVDVVINRNFRKGAVGP